MTEVMDSKTYLPTGPGDRDQHTGRLVDQLRQVIDEAWETVTTGPLLEKNGTSSHGRIFYGWYLGRTLPEEPPVRLPAPSLEGPRDQLPLAWVNVDATSGWSHQKLSHAFSPLNTSGEPGLFADFDNFLTPLKIPPYGGLNDVVASVADGLEKVAELLDSAVPPGQVVVPDTPPSESEPDSLEEWRIYAAGGADQRR